MALVTVQFQWDDQHGECYDCGLPAAFSVGLDIVCAVCAANHAVDGDVIVRLDSEA